MQSQYHLVNSNTVSNVVYNRPSMSNVNVVSPPPIRTSMGPVYGSRVNSNSAYTVVPSSGISNITGTARFGGVVTPTQVRFDSPSKVTQHQVFTKPFTTSVPVYQPTHTTLATGIKILPATGPTTVSVTGAHQPQVQPQVQPQIQQQT